MAGVRRRAVHPQAVRVRALRGRGGRAAALRRAPRHVLHPAEVSNASHVGNTVLRHSVYVKTLSFSTFCIILRKGMKKK